MLESKRRAIIFFVLSIILALSAGGLVLYKVKDMNNNLGTMVNVFVANRDIPSRTLITPDDVATIEIPKRILKDYHITDPKELINRVSVVPLSKEDMIMDYVLKELSAVVNEKNRLITLMGSDRVIFDEALENLDRVDIIVSHNFNGKPETTVFMKDVKVASIAKKDNQFNGVRLEVPLEQAPELIHMQNYADSVRILKANVGKEATADANKKKPVEQVQKQEPANSSKTPPTNGNQPPANGVTQPPETQAGNVKETQVTTGEGNKTVSN